MKDEMSQKSQPKNDSFSFVEKLLERNWISEDTKKSSFSKRIANNLAISSAIQPSLPLRIRARFVTDEIYNAVMQKQIRELKARLEKGPLEENEFSRIKRMILQVHCNDPSEEVKPLKIK